MAIFRPDLSAAHQRWSRQNNGHHFEIVLNLQVFGVLEFKFESNIRKNEIQYVYNRGHTAEFRFPVDFLELI